MRKVLLGIAAFVIVALVSLFKINSGPELSVQISAPSSILVGETFTLVLHLSNPHSEPVTLDSVEIDTAVFVTFKVISVTPEPSKPSQSFGPESFGWEYWTFQRVFEPATTETVEFEFRANLVGSYEIELRVCNLYGQCTSTDVPILVAPPPK